MQEKFKKIIVMLGVVAALLPQVSYAQDFFTAKEFDDRCGREGAINLVDELVVGHQENPIWENILDNIASGDEEWIRASSCIGRSFGYSNQTVVISLNIVWAEALPKNPQAVLALSGMDISLARICSFPIIEPERAWAAQYVKDTLAALEAIPDDAKMWNMPLAIERDVCILRLKDAYVKKYDYAD